MRVTAVQIPHSGYAAAQIVTKTTGADRPEKTRSH
nr:MAG TPA: hypothetical protein [Bacteriophage sp.]